MKLSFLTAKFQQTLKNRLLIINILFQKVLKLIKVKINFSGEGVFGRVYLALHKELNFMVALKKIDK
jgi:hypothetical protein